MAAAAAIWVLSIWASLGHADGSATLLGAGLDDAGRSHLHRVQASTRPVPTAETWSVYRNDRFGFRLDYPSSLFVPELPAQVDRVSFRTRDGRARLTAYASTNHERKSLAEIRSDYLESAGNLVVTYSRVIGRGIVVSGESGSDIVYTRIVLSPASDVISVFEITYPSEWKEQFDPIVTRISRSFRAGSMRR